MKLNVVQVPSIKEPIQPSPGFAKKELAEYKLDGMGLCGFACVYCSSNSGYYLRRNREPFADLTESQLGLRTYPADDSSLTFEWPDLLPNLTKQLSKKPQDWGDRKTLVYSMLTDGFSPNLVANGTTQRVLELVLKHTKFRIRVLTKNAAVGSTNWIPFFEQHRDRFVVGLSTGTTDDAWAKCVEIGTPPPSARLRSLHRLQDRGIATYGMLCPIFPDVLEGDRVEQLVDAVRPDLVEHVWAEPYNDRANWRKVRDGYAPDSPGFNWMTSAFEKKNSAAWSGYATELYVRLHVKARAEGWLHKLRYLLYEADITSTDAQKFAGLEGVLLQSKPAANGFSKHPVFAQLQEQAWGGRAL